MVTWHKSINTSYIKPPLLMLCEEESKGRAAPCNRLAISNRALLLHERRVVTGRPQSPKTKDRPTSENDRIKFCVERVLYI